MFIFTNLDLFCIDNARVIYRKIRYYKFELTRTALLHVYYEILNSDITNPPFFNL